MGNKISFFSGLIVYDWISNHAVTQGISNLSNFLGYAVSYLSSGWWYSRLFFVIFIIAVGYKVYKIRKVSKRLKTYLQDKHNKYSRLGEKLDALGTPVQNYKKYTTMQMEELQSLLISKKSVNPIDILEAFQVSCLNLANTNNGCIAEISFDADVTALLNELDAGKQPASKIHGLPIAVQDCICIEKIQPTGGLSYVDKNFGSANSVIVEVLKYSAMSVPFVTTNTASFYSNMLTQNRLFGKCVLPSHPDRVFLGQSGGLVSTILRNGAPVGVGLDFIGGLRIPASYGGLVSLHSSSRFSLKGIYLTEGIQVLPLNIGVGPVGRSVSNVIDVFRSLLSPSMQELDPNTLVVPFDEQKVVSKEELNIGYFMQLNDDFPVLPCMERTVGEAVDLLKSKGHKVMPFKIPDVEDFVYITLASLLNLDIEGFDFVINKAGGDILGFSDKLRMYLHNLPSFMSPALSVIINLSQNRPHMVAKIAQKVLRKNESISSLHQRALRFANSFMKCWNEAKLDVLIGPVTPYPAMINPKPTDILATVIYSSFVNICGYSAGFVKTSSVTKEDINAATSIDLSSHFPKEILNEQTTAQILPTGVQVISKPYCEETILNVMDTLEANSLHFS